MNIFEVFAKRYSHKEDFLPEAVPLADLERIAQAGLSAPTGQNRQVVRLIILPDRAALDPMSAISPFRGLESAPAAIVVLTDKKKPEGQPDFQKEDYSAAVAHMHLAATALGYASLWLDYPYWEEAKEKQARDALGVPDTFKLWATIPIGKPAAEGSRREKLPFSERVSYIKF